MVKVNDEYPVTPDGNVDVEAWLTRLHESQLKKGGESIRDLPQLLRACDVVRQTAANPATSVPGSIWSRQQGMLSIGLQMVEILVNLKLDQPSLVAAILYRAVRDNCLTLAAVKKGFGDQVAGLVEGVLGMAVVSTLQDCEQARKWREQEQVEQIRKMLIAIVNDVRVALIKLAERTCAIRSVKQADRERQLRVAREVSEIHAPLARRLGVGCIKWELEDLAFRYMRPHEYKKIARLLDERRVDRELYLQDVMTRVQQALAAEGIEAEVSGRNKNIYSIWRKMQRKGVEFEGLYDIRALRIHVHELQQCYAALGVVHSMWSPVPHEFDDYIATPKANGYQSLHTAVLGCKGKTLEVQIRTHDMHEDAELGVCAHWKYKDSSPKGRYNDSHEQKLGWLRQVITWQVEIGQGVESLADLWRLDVEPDRVYVFTRDGHVVDLPAGATPVDFAYRVHTEVGHRCCGARVGGRIVPLNTCLNTGDQVEIMTAGQASPSRDWLNSSQGYVCTSRARAKITNWFRRQNREANMEAGRSMLDAEFRRLGLSTGSYGVLAESLALDSPEELFARVGGGDLRTLQVVQAAQRLEARSSPAEPQFFSSARVPLTKPRTSNEGDGIRVEGVGRLLAQMARCCQPVPGDPISGYVTLGRGVSVHRSDCGNFLRMQQDEPCRIIDVGWQRGEKKSTWPVSVRVDAYDRAGLLRDITLVLANEKINVTDLESHRLNEDNLSRLSLVLEVPDLCTLGRVLNGISQLSNVLDVWRQTDA
ncbi:MAG: GTP diphosphokinase [Kistimonas sp.]|nr:GTP diphosphokinase [Kistimonas sp.]